VSLLEAHGIVKLFGNLCALDGVALTVEPGQIHGLIGPNGSGKTTLLRIIAGPATPTAGRVAFPGTDITAHSPPHPPRAGLTIKYPITRLLPAPAACSAWGRA